MLPFSSSTVILSVTFPTVWLVTVTLVIVGIFSTVNVVTFEDVDTMYRESSSVFIPVKFTSTFTSLTVEVV